MNYNLTRAFIVVFIGLCLLATAGWVYLQHTNLERTGIVVSATVVTNIEESDEDGTCYAPLIRFKTIKEQVVSFQHNVCTSPPQYQPGQQIIVIYQPEDPTNFAIQGEINLLSIILALAGGLFVFSALKIAFTKKD